EQPGPELALLLRCPAGRSTGDRGLRGDDPAALRGRVLRGARLPWLDSGESERTGVPEARLDPAGLPVRDDPAAHHRYPRGRGLQSTPAWGRTRLQPGVRPHAPAERTALAWPRRARRLHLFLGGAVPHPRPLRKLAGAEDAAVPIDAPCPRRWRDTRRCALTEGRILSRRARSRFPCGKACR